MARRSKGGAHRRLPAVANADCRPHAPLRRSERLTELTSSPSQEQHAALRSEGADSTPSASDRLYQRQGPYRVPQIAHATPGKNSSWPHRPAPWLGLLSGCEMHFEAQVQRWDDVGRRAPRVDGGCAGRRPLAFVI